MGVQTAGRPRRLALVILAIGLAVFITLAAASRMLYDQTENRLLQQRTNEAGAVLEVSVGQIRTPLDAAVTLAEVTNGDPAAFGTAVQPFVGEGKPFTSAALFRLGEGTPVVVAGPDMSLTAGGPEQARAMLATAGGESFVIVDLLDGAQRRLGYAVTDAGGTGAFVVYGERTLGADPNARRRNDQPFAQLDYAIYLGPEESDAALLGSSTRNLPIDGRRATADVDFGDNTIHLVMTPIGHLSGSLFAHLWWIVLAIGTAVSVAFARLAMLLVDRRDMALELAADNERLFDEQRHIAETLQLSLLPQHLDPPPGTQVAARYWPAGAANLIGGDFYDVFRVADDRWAVTIGDVCGKGIEAAALTGRARHTVRAAARSAVTVVASDVLRAVHREIADHQPATYCTACFVSISTSANAPTRIEMSLGGHPQPLLCRADGSVSAVGMPGSLLGMIEPTLADTQFEVFPGDTLVLYTDGLTDAPGQQAVPIEEIEWLLADSVDLPVESLADEIRVLKRRRRPNGSADDTAVIILRFGVTDQLPATAVA